jgi:hypothetical protein
MVWRGPKDREDEGNATANGLGAICHGCRGEKELLGARCIFPAYDCSTVEEDLE